MPHIDREIAELEQKLGQLKARQANENAARNSPRPTGIPSTWVPLIFDHPVRGFIVVGWIDPDYQASAFPNPR